MRLMPQRIKKQNIQPFQLIQRRLGNLAVIGQIRRRSKAVAINLSLSVDQDDRLKAYSQHVHRPVDRLQFKLRQAAEFVVSIEDVAEHAPQKRSGIGAPVEWQLGGLVARTQRAPILPSPA